MLYVRNCTSEVRTTQLSIHNEPRGESMVILGESRSDHLTQADPQQLSLLPDCGDAGSAR